MFAMRMSLFDSISYPPRTISAYENMPLLFHYKSRSWANIRNRVANTNGCLSTPSFGRYIDGPILDEHSFVQCAFAQWVECGPDDIMWIMRSINKNPAQKFKLPPKKCTKKRLTWHASGMAVRWQVMMPICICSGFGDLLKFLIFHQRYI